jgi:para-nitrobenzyl esterase
MRRWDGVRDATRFPAAPVQPTNRDVPQSEDCLYLNVWAPEGAHNAPVFVWIHGGGFVGGYAFEPMYDGTGFADDGVVVVTVGYRLGVLGFLDVSPLLGDTYAGSANNALRDVIAALTWVQENIATFGGDPRHVTVGGESAGAKLTDILMGVPSAQPLFAQMISESGGAERIWQPERAKQVAVDFWRLWTNEQGRTLAQLKEAPARELIALQQRFMQDYFVHFPLRAEVDGTLIPGPPLDSIRHGSARKKRLLLGTNRDESAMFLGPHPVEDPGGKDLGNLTVEQFRPLEQEYARLYPEMSNELRRIRSVSAEEYWIPSIRVAEAHVTGGGAALVYRMDYTEPDGRYPGLAFHSLDVRFVWEHLPKADVSEEDRHFARIVHDAWVSFIKDGTPRANGLPPWPEYNLKERATMLLNRTSHVEYAPQARELAVWEGKLE